MPQDTLSTWSAAKLSGSLLWSKSYQPLGRAGTVERRGWAKEQLY